MLAPACTSCCILCMHFVHYNTEHLRTLSSRTFLTSNDGTHDITRTVRTNFVTEEFCSVRVKNLLLSVFAFAGRPSKRRPSAVCPSSSHCVASRGHFAAWAGVADPPCLTGQWLRIGMQTRTHSGIQNQKGAQVSKSCFGRLILVSVAAWIMVSLLAPNPRTKYGPKSGPAPASPTVDLVGVGPKCELSLVCESWSLAANMGDTSAPPRHKIRISHKKVVEHHRK